MTDWITIALGLSFAAWIIFYWVAIRPFLNDHDSDPSATASDSDHQKWFR
jgi:hypothetical protein